MVYLLRDHFSFFITFSSTNVRHFECILKDIGIFCYIVCKAIKNQFLIFLPKAKKFANARRICVSIYAPPTGGTFCVLVNQNTKRRAMRVRLSKSKIYSNLLLFFFCLILCWFTLANQQRIKLTFIFLLFDPLLVRFSELIDVLHLSLRCSSASHVVQAQRTRIIRCLHLSFHLLLFRSSALPLFRSSALQSISCKAGIDTHTDALFQTFHIKIFSYIFFNVLVLFATSSLMPI